ncbi:MAG TPA: ATP-binding protein [Candidatus Limnocylindria bacterium]|nr:ATP-binding protein [Candidatus Limnocylindria bacterium]
MTPEATQASPLALAALAVVADGATATELEQRFDAAGARLADGTAQRLLDQLAGLGLIRAASPGRFVPTSIGQRRIADQRPLGDDETHRLAELERLRTDLLSTIAHELRTPLTAVRTSVGLLQDTHRAPDEGQRQTLLATIERNADRMQRLVGDILELARFRSGTVKLQLRRFDARRLAAAAAESVAPLAAAANQRIAVDAPDRPVWVFGDHRRLEQALVNLLSNAQKYSPDGSGIRLRVSHAGDEVAWSVTDEGPGIRPGDRARLFERFFVGRNDRGGGAGVGLGLPTALAIAQAHGGRVEVDTAPGSGSTFTLAVPAQGPEGEAEA